MSHRRRVLGLVVGLSLGAVACAAGTGTEVEGSGTEAPADPAAADDATGPLLALAVDLEQQLATANPGTDLAIAPLPVAASLSQLRAGAGGTTAEELDRVLHTPPVPDAAAQLASGLSSLQRTFESREGDQRAATTRTGNVSIDLADSLWIQKGTTLERPWLDQLATTWGTGVRTTDFRSDPETARKAVNGWITDATDGHIDQLAPRGSISPTTRILAAGAVYLKAPWVTPFAETDTRLEPFRHLDGSTVTVPMMRIPDLTDVRYGTGEGWTAIDLPYLGRSLWMTVIIPDAGRFTDVEQALGGDGLQQILTTLSPATLDLALPKFGFTTDLPLTDALRALGLGAATDPLAADFGGVSPEPLSLTSVLHQTYLAVAEQGTEATATAPAPEPSATTAPLSTGTSRPSTAGTGTTGGTGSTTTTLPAARPGAPGAIVVKAAQPFLVLVRDRPTGAPLLYGRVLSPNS